jgi:hypothetical protein
MMRFFVICGLVALAGPAAAEEPKVDAGRLAKVVAPFLDERTLVVFHVDLTRVDPEAVVKRVGAITGLDPKGLSREAEGAKQFLDPLRKVGARELFQLFGLADLMAGPITVVPLEEGADAQAIAKIIGEPGNPPVADKREGAVIGAPKGTLARLPRMTPAKFPELADALRTAGDAPVRVAFLLPADTRRVLEETLPTLPEELGGGPVKAYTRGFSWATLAIDATPAVRVRLTIASPDEASAKALHEAVGRLLPALAKQKVVRDVVPTAEKIVPLVTPKLQGKSLTLTLDEKALGEIVRPLLAGMSFPDR